MRQKEGGRKRASESGERALSGGVEGGERDDSIENRWCARINQYGALARTKRTRKQQARSLVPFFGRRNDFLQRDQLKYCDFREHLLIMIHTQKYRNLFPASPWEHQLIWSIKRYLKGHERKNIGYATRISETSWAELFTRIHGPGRGRLFLVVQSVDSQLRPRRNEIEGNVVCAHARMRSRRKTRAERGGRRERAERGREER